MFIYVENIAETYETVLITGATSIMEVISDEDSGYTAGFVDPFSNLWWVKFKK